MKKLTFAFSCQLNDVEDWIKAGTVVEIADTWRKHEKFTPVIITEAYTYAGTPLYIKQVEYFSNESFIELKEAE